MDEWADELVSERVGGWVGRGNGGMNELVDE